MKQNRIQKLITFSPQLYQLIELNAQKVGLSFPEYIRTLAVDDVRKEAEKGFMVSETAEKRIGKSLEDIKRGRYLEVDPSDEKALNQALGLKS